MITSNRVEVQNKQKPIAKTVSINIEDKMNVYVDINGQRKKEVKK